MTLTKIYLDCDTGIDDALALVLLANSPATELVGIGTVSGNTSAEEAARNTLSLLRMIGRDCPVAVGSHDPLLGAYGGGAPHVHGTNGIGDMILPKGGDPQRESAVDMILRLAHEHGRDLDIVAIGPLTNLAAALQREPALPEMVGTLTIMGGAVWVPGNITSVAEANVHNDADAAGRVLRAGFNTVLVPLDVTLQHCFDDTDVAAFTGTASPLHVALGEMLDRYMDFYESVSTVRRAPLHDPLAAAVAVQLVDVKVRSVAVAVSLSGEARGRTQPVEIGPAVQIVVESASDTPTRIRDSILGSLAPVVA